MATQSVERRPPDVEMEDTVDDPVPASGGQSQGNESSDAGASSGQ
ncbi:hypothetical protein [Paraburkholderia terrae]|nr:hypothetical protein [Paraburkholderia terrae]GJG99495.1 hypothetical protein CBA19C8_03085 [Paraburkholderia terrae]